MQEELRVSDFDPVLLLLFLHLILHRMGLPHVLVTIRPIWKNFRITYQKLSLIIEGRIEQRSRKRMENGVVFSSLLGFFKVTDTGSSYLRMFWCRICNWKDVCRCGHSCGSRTSTCWRTPSDKWCKPGACLNQLCGGPEKGNQYSMTLELVCQICEKECIL